MNKPDQLEELFRLQKQLNKRIGVDADRMTESDRQQWLLQYCRAMSQEVAELTDCVPWKWWPARKRFAVLGTKTPSYDHVLLHTMLG